MGPRILILCRGHIGTHMSSPGIRGTAMARVLAEQLPGARVTLAGLNRDPVMPKDLPFRAVHWRSRDVLGLVNDHDIIISSGLPPHVAPFFPAKRFVVDLFSQYAMEWMEVGMQHYRGYRRHAWVERTRTILAMQLTLADFVLTCNERQRDSYIGMMTSLGLISPAAYDADPTLRRYIDVAPHGLRPEPPVRGRPVLRGVHPGFKDDDKIIIWNGGLLQWYDPLTLIEALRRLNRDDIKLLFLGAAYPGIRDLGIGVRFQDSKGKARENGQMDRTIFFEEGWVSHDTASQYVLESDIGVCSYFDNLETRYSHRTRFVDLIWAELPFICTHGDVVAEQVEKNRWGVVVPEEDPAALACAIERLLDDADFRAECRRNLAAARPDLQWDVTLRPLVEFCNDDRPPLAPKWERLPGLAQRVVSYGARRTIYHLAFPRD